MLARIVQHDHHVFWPDELSLNDEHIPVSLIMGHRQLTDAYLLGLALRRRGRVVTLDESISSLLPARDPRQDAIEFIGIRTKAGEHGARAVADKPQR